jgi:UDP-N-acetylglucosamine 3-dehydrogenase
VLGLGFMGSTHLKALRGLAGAKLAAVFSNDEKQLSGDLTAVQGNIGGPGEMMDFSNIGRYRDVDALLADRTIDAVDICLPTDFHEPVVLAALRAGKHVLVEKPMALDGAAADRILEEAQSSGHLLMTAHVLRFVPEYVALREAIRSSRLGKVRFAEFRRRCAAPDWGGWLNQPAKSGGGAFDLLIHDVDMCIHLFGVPEAVSATGHVDPSAGLDCIHAWLYYADGPAVLVSGGWMGKGLPFSMEFAVTMDAGTMDFSSAGRPLSFAGQPLPCSGGDGYCAEIAYFVECCASGRMPELCPPKESAATVKLMRLLLDAREHNGEKLPCTI